MSGCVDEQKLFKCQASQNLQGDLGGRAFGGGGGYGDSAGFHACSLRGPWDASSISLDHSGMTLNIRDGAAFVYHYL